MMEMIEEKILEVGARNKSRVGLSLLAIVLVMKLFTGTFGKTKVLAALSTNI